MADISDLITNIVQTAVSETINVINTSAELFTQSKSTPTSTHASVLNTPKFLNHNIESKSIILVLSPISYIYASNGVTAYGSIRCENLLSEYQKTMKTYNLWKRKFDKIKNSNHPTDVRSSSYFKYRMDLLKTGFESYRGRFISALVEHFLRSFNKIYIETPPTKEDIDKNGFRNIHYSDDDLCKLALEINAYNAFIDEFREQINMINEYGVVNEEFKELHLLSTEITNEAHNHCNNCGSELVSKDFLSCEFQMISCPSCHKIISEYPNMMNNLNLKIKQLHL